MKYVVTEGQSVAINGSIRNSETVHDGEYSGEQKVITDDFVDFEHTDGLNLIYAGAGIRHTFFTHKWLSMGAYENLLCWGNAAEESDVTLLSRERHDKYKIAGLAFMGSGGLELGFWNHFFLAI